MGTPESGLAGGLHAPGPEMDPVQRLLDARVAASERMEQLLTSTYSGDITVEPHDGTELLLFWCRGVQCALPLTSLREVLPEAPVPVYLPFSPAWMLGIFPLRNELVGLVDPAALLLSGDGISAANPDIVVDDPSASFVGLPGARSAQTAILVGSEGRCLAWIVDGVGEIAHAQDDQICQSPDAGSAGLSIMPRYVAGMYRAPDAPSESVVLRAEALLDDMLAALTEGGEPRHG